MYTRGSTGAPPLWKVQEFWENSYIEEEGLFNLIGIKITLIDAIASKRFFNRAFVMLFLLNLFKRLCRRSARYDHRRRTRRRLVRRLRGRCRRRLRCSRRLGCRCRRRRRGRRIVLFRRFRLFSKSRVLIMILSTTKVFRTRFIFSLTLRTSIRRLRL